ncbi:MAG: hypothetical protein ACI9KE_000943 [Polyangiales bacterium]|jgi:hypothetical protein
MGSFGSKPECCQRVLPSRFALLTWRDNCQGVHRERLDAKLGGASVFANEPHGLGDKRVGGRIPREGEARDREPNGLGFESFGSLVFEENFRDGARGRDGELGPLA